jgi:hypothetical protein
MPPDEVHAGGGGRFDMADDAHFLRAQAEKCRWLAQRVNAGDVSETLLAMARDYDERAERSEEGPDEA